MPVNETKLQAALDKISTKRDTARTQLRQYDEILTAIMSIRQIKVLEYDVDGIETGFHNELPKDPLIQDTVSTARRQEIYDKLVTLIEAL